MPVTYPSTFRTTCSQRRHISCHSPWQTVRQWPSLLPSTPCYSHWLHICLLMNACLCGSAMNTMLVSLRLPPACVQRLHIAASLRMAFSPFLSACVRPSHRAACHPIQLSWSCVRSATKRNTVIAFTTTPASRNRAGILPSSTSWFVCCRRLTLHPARARCHDRPRIVRSECMHVYLHLFGPRATHRSASTPSMTCASCTTSTSACRQRTSTAREARGAGCRRAP